MRAAKRVFAGLRRLAFARIRPEGPANAALERLRGLSAGGRLEPRAPIVPGIFLDVDPEAGCEARYSTRPGMLLEAEFRLRRQPRWLALHVVLGPVRLDGRAGFGVALKAQAPQSRALCAVLRSGLAGGFVESALPRPLPATPEARPATALLDLAGAGGPPHVPPRALWRDLILFLPPEEGRLVLHAMRVFVL